MLRRILMNASITFLLITPPSMFSSATVSQNPLKPYFPVIPVVKIIPPAPPKTSSIIDYPEQMAMIENTYGMRPGDLAKLEILESDGGKNLKHKKILDTNNKLCGETAIGNFGIMPSTCKLPLLKGLDPEDVVEAAEMTGRLYADNLHILKKKLPNLKESRLRDLAIGSHKANVRHIIRMVRKGTDVKDITAGESVRAFIKRYKSIKIEPKKEVNGPLLAGTI